MKHFAWFSKYTVLSISILLLHACETEDINSPGALGDANYNLSGPQFEGFGPAGDQYAEFEESPFVMVNEAPISTFSVDADGASYSNVRRFIMTENELPPRGAIRTEELINYFSLDYEYVNTGDPISLNGEVSACPWSPSHKLIRIGLKGKPIPRPSLPASNFVFLIDVSGSMGSEDKLPLLKNGFKQFTDELSVEDRVSIVTYAGVAGVALGSTSGREKEKIKNAIDRLGAGGSTAGAEGIITAYEIAHQNLVPNGNNRIIIGTDGDFNVGVSSRDELVELIEQKRESGIFLTVLGVGRGNLNDAALEQIANHGNGTYEYIDNLEQLKKVFIYEYHKFFTVAKDVKIQVEFNPVKVEAYRLIGYENRSLNTEDFEDDTKDAGEIGSNQNITALYEIIPASGSNLRVSPTFIIDFRYKLPNAETSVAMELEIFDRGNSFSQSSDFMKFTASVASFSMVLANSEYRGTSSYDQIRSWLNETNLNDQHGFKSEFQDIVARIADGP